MSLRYGFMCLGLAKANPQHMGLADQGSLRTAIYQYISLQTSIRLNASIASLTYPLVYPLSQKSATYSMQAYSILTTRSSQVNNILGFKHIQNRSDKDSIVDSNLPLPSHRDCLGRKKLENRWMLKDYKDAHSSTCMCTFVNLERAGLFYTCLSPVDYLSCDEKSSTWYHQLFGLILRG